MFDQNKITELEDLAYRGAEMPIDLEYPEQLLFLKFRYLYAYAKISHLSPEQGKREKQLIIGTYKTDSFVNAQLNAAVKLWKNVELISAEVRKSELINEPLVKDLLDKIYNSKVGRDFDG